MQEMVKKISAAASAGAALMQLLLKLENDGHLKAVGTGRPVVVLLPEMIAYVVSRFSLNTQERELLIRHLIHILPPEDEDIQKDLALGILERTKAFSADPDAIPDVYEVLCRFDAMAQEYEGAFYARMHVENPGRLAEYYLQLLEAVYRIAADTVKKEDPDWKKKLEEFRDKMTDILL